MSNCYLGGPCDCRECRPLLRYDTCPSCGFRTAVEIERAASWGYDRKGIRAVTFEQPAGGPRDLPCYRCRK